ncbi:MAG: hypothetical protein KAH18_13465, partial [Psychromonas sp.]|nr:hypothetical protein [Psychromonas sp.]
MKRILISLVCCTPLLFSSVTVQSIDLVGPDSQSTLSLEVYGPVGGHETLWGISEKLKPNNSVSVYQTLIAIYKLNPYAFEDGDVNKIIAHHIIKVPPLDFIKKQSNKEALALINKKQPRVKKSKPSTAKQPKKVPIKKSEVAKTTDNQSLTNLVLNEETANTETNSQLEDQIKSLKKELADVNEKLVAHNESNQLLKLKIQGLTDQIANLNTQLSTELENQQKTNALSQKYLQQLENIKPAPFSGDGLVNEILRFITSSIIYLLAFMFLPIILLIVIFVFILRRNDKRQLEEQEQELAESSSFNEEGRFDSLLSTDP